MKILPIVRWSETVQMGGVKTSEVFSDRDPRSDEADFAGYSDNSQISVSAIPLGPTQIHQNAGFKTTLAGLGD